MFGASVAFLYLFWIYSPRCIKDILCDSDANIKGMKKLLGHSDIQTTMMIYIEISQEFMVGE